MDRGARALSPGRHYDIFGALAGVRADDVPVIAAPRGLPIDASEPVRNAHDEELASLGMATWRASWLTLKELLAYDWSNVEPFADIMLASIRAMREHGDPDNVRAVFWFSS